MRSERLRKTTLCASSSALAPHGHQSGQVLFDSVPLADVPEREQAARIGFVMQDPDAQIMTDKVWHELAFVLKARLRRAHHALARGGDGQLLRHPALVP